MHRTELKAVSAAMLAIGAAMAAVIVNSGTSKDDTSMKFREIGGGHTSLVSETYNVTESRATERTSAAVKEHTTSAVRTTSNATEKASEVAAELHIDINAADVTELCKLNGIGEAKAEAIIAYRETHGPFNNIEEIMQVSGIGEEIFARIAGDIYVTDPVYDEPSSAVTEPETVTAAGNITETEPTSVHSLTLEEAAPININTADPAELTLLPHVDEHVAEKIIELREKIGGYRNTYELLYIDELTQKQVAEIVKFVTVGQ